LRWSYLFAANENENASSNAAEPATAPFTAESAARGFLLSAPGCVFAQQETTKHSAQQNDK
jgi:hypothetical protein